jgi:RNA polymerase sigma factor (sigma-70 family)
MKRALDLWRRATQVNTDGAADGELLARFIQERDEDAFAQLVDRHGPLVYGACRRLLLNPLDVEDVFQATFLVLVRRAAHLRDRTLAPWLHQVAVWTASNLRRRNARRLAAIERLGEIPAARAVPDLTSVDARLDVDTLLLSLPRKYRVPLVLCCLQGCTKQEAAAQLGCPVNTVSSLLGRGLAKLRKRVAGRDPAIVLAIAGSFTVPSVLHSAAIRAAIMFHTSALSVAASPAVAALTQGVLRMFWLKKLAFASVVLVAIGTMGLGIWGSGTGQQATAQVIADPKQDLNRQFEDNNARMRQERMERSLEELNARVKRLESQFDRDMPAQGGGGSLELIVGSGQPPLEIKELDKNGKVLLRVWPSDLNALKLFLTRSHMDRDGPRRLVARVDKDYPADKVKEVFAICREAGYNPDGVPPARPTGTSSMPSEEQKAYVIEPPDIVRIEIGLRHEKGLEPIHQLPSGADYIVRPDGTVSLGTFWSPVHVAGMSPPAAADAIRKHILAECVLNNRVMTPAALVVNLDVVSTNSKVYYVINAGPEGESVTRLPITGKDTVLSAIMSQEVPKSDHGVAEMFILRPDGTGNNKKISVDWKAIAETGSKERTNYPILAGDRIFVKLQK